MEEKLCLLDAVLRERRCSVLSDRDLEFQILPDERITEAKDIMSFGDELSFYTPYVCTLYARRVSGRCHARALNGNPHSSSAWCYRGDGSLVGVLGLSQNPYVMEIYMAVVGVMLTARPGIVQD